MAFRVIVGEDIPDFRTISDFRKDNLDHMQSLFVDTLQVCAAAGLARLDRVALDGAKIKANASRHKAMSYDRMKQEEERLAKEIAWLIAQAEAADDEQFGNRRGDELPEELARRESKLKKIREAREALEEAARQKAADHAANMKSEGRQHRTAPDKAVPHDKDQRNFTDPDSKIAKTSNKEFDQCGNAQFITIEDHVILAADVTNQANNVRQVEPMVDQLQSNIAAANQNDSVQEFIADAGHYSSADAVTNADMAPRP